MNSPDSITKEIGYTKILKLGKEINTLIHELNHCALVLYHFISNGEKSIFTPNRDELKNKFKEIYGNEGGQHIEPILFSKVINRLKLGEALYILNIENYEKKTLKQFREDFMNLTDFTNLKNREDLNIKGEFQSLISIIDFN